MVKCSRGVSKRLSLWESWREAPERARMLTVIRGRSDSIALTKSLLIAALAVLSCRACPLSRFAPAPPKGEPFVEEGRPCGISKASPLGRGVTKGDGEGKDADGDSRAQR